MFWVEVMASKKQMHNSIHFIFYEKRPHYILTVQNGFQLLLKLLTCENMTSYTQAVAGLFLLTP